MEPFITVFLVVLAFLAGRLFPTQSIIKKISDKTMRLASREEQARQWRMYQAVKFCGVYTCTSVESCRVHSWARRTETVVLKNDEHPDKCLTLSCEEVIAPGQKVRVCLRNPDDGYKEPAQGYGDLLEVVPIQEP